MVELWSSTWLSAGQIKPHTKLSQQQVLYSILKKKVTFSTSIFAKAYRPQVLTSRYTDVTGGVNHCQQIKTMRALPGDNVSWTLIISPNRALEEGSSLRLSRLRGGRYSRLLRVSFARDSLREF